MRKCPACAELILCEAVKCRYCGEHSPAESDVHIPETPGVTQSEPPVLPKRSINAMGWVGLGLLGLAALVVYALVSRNNGSGVGQTTGESGNSHGTGTISSTDDCPRDDNQIIHLQVGDSVQIYQSIAPAGSEYKNLPADSGLSKKLNLTYVKVLGGPHAGEYCWVSTVNIR